ncbi:unnamed protein product, partial [Choristocarpus tenellus]
GTGVCVKVSKKAAVGEEEEQEMEIKREEREEKEKTVVKLEEGEELKEDNSQEGGDGRDSAAAAEAAATAIEELETKVDGGMTALARATAEVFMGKPSGKGLAIEPLKTPCSPQPSAHDLLQVKGSRDTHTPPPPAAADTPASPCNINTLSSLEWRVKAVGGGEGMNKALQDQSGEKSTVKETKRVTVTEEAVLEMSNQGVAFHPLMWDKISNRRLQWFVGP